MVVGVFDGSLVCLTCGVLALDNLSSSSFHLFHGLPMFHSLPIMRVIIS